MKRFVCIHGHFYQPPRENPWLEVVEVQDSAAPYHDWNAAVAAQCYAPNAAARILDHSGAIARIQNNYAHISFNFGPTLLSWLQEHDPATYQALLQADAISLERLGRGNAMAQVYNHLIMPLASPRDALTQVRWGLADFRRRFGREPSGMWLAETAVDLATLQVLADQGIEWTILSPGQCARVRPPQGGWKDAPQGLDSRRPYQVELPGGGSMAVFFYHGELSRAVAFERLLGDGAAFARRIKRAFDHDPPEDQLVLLATDGESYGHHHRFGEMALAFCLDELSRDDEIELTNPTAYLAAHPPAWQAEILEHSSWSCAHGVERWRSDCGCAVDPGKGWNQAWRGPLRQSLDQLRDRLDVLFQQQGSVLFKDPWATRDDYTALLGPKPAMTWQGFLARHASHELSTKERVRAAKLLECQHWALYMFTSCGWFFDDLAGIEAVQNLRFAARALQLADELDGGGWEEGLLATLQHAHSNRPEQGDGRQVWQSRVAPARVGPRRVVAHAIISGVLGDEPPPTELYCYDLKTISHRHRHNLGLHVSWGRVEVWHQCIGEKRSYCYGALYSGGHDFSAWVSPADTDLSLTDLSQKVEQPLRLAERRTLAALLEERLGGPPYTLGDLFLEGRRALARRVLSRTLDGFRETARSLYQDGRGIMAYLRGIKVPPPKVYLAVAEAVLTDELVRILESLPPGPLPPQVGVILQRTRELALNLDSPHLARKLEAVLVRDLSLLIASPSDPAPADHACQILDVAQALELKLELWQAQNLFSQLRTELQNSGLPALVKELGRRLNFAL